MKRFLTALLTLCLCLPPACAESFTARLSLDGADAATRNNIARAALSLTGTNLKAGEEFSFNALVGSRSAERGYERAANGRGAKVTGGGVAQVASVVDLALRAAGQDVRYTRRDTYGANFRGSYVGSADDAILVDYASGIDYAFVNEGEPIVLTLWQTDSYLYCTVATVDADMGTTPPGFGFDAGNGESCLSRSEIVLRGDENLLGNIALAADSVNDTVLMPGDIFSFNDTVGERSQRAGYTVAVNGRGVNVLGGGVAQVASALWLTARQVDDIAVIQKETYGKRYNQSYVASSNDAIATDYKSGLDFRFKNIGDEPLTLCVYIEDDALICEIQR